MSSAAADGILLAAIPRRCRLPVTAVSSFPKLRLAAVTSDPRALPRGRRAVLAFWALDVQVAEQTGVQVGARALWLHVHVHELGQLAAVVTPKRHVARWGAVRSCTPKLALWTANAF